MKESPLFWPVQTEKNHLSVLDETLVPKLEYIKVRNYLNSVKVIKQMRTRAFGQFLIVFYTFLLELSKMKSSNKKTILAKLTKIKIALDKSRPTFPFPELTSLVIAWAKELSRKEKDIRQDLEFRILGFLEGVKQQRYRRAGKAASLLNNNDTVLTHCNASGEIPLIGEICRKQGKRVKFIATETRPYFQGSRLTAWELNRAGFDVTVIVDSAVAQVMHEGKIDKVIVAADCLAQNGDIANKIGTYNIAILARKFNLPFYVLVPPVSKHKTGQDIPIEIRPQKELLEYKGIKITSPGVKGYYPAFDVTPKELITKHVSLA